MKKTFFLMLFFASLAIHAQIGVETTTIEGSGLIDFPSGTTKGIILPQVTNANNITSAAQGTFIFDEATAKVKFFDGTNWVDITGKPGTSATLLPGAEKNNTKGVIIGDPNSTASGVLILESKEKALILPKVVNPTANVMSPTAGMMCYDPVAKLICFYNGNEWAYWGNID